MKRILLLAAACASLATAAAAAQTATPAPAPPPPPGAGPGARSGDGPGGHMMMRRFGGQGGRMMQRATPEERAKRRADMFAKMDANKNGQVTFDEYRGYIEAERLERQKRQFERFSGGQSAVTLDQLNARALQREREMEQRFQDRRGRRGPPPGGPVGQ